jgi:non-ribosomal peptide synthetase component F/thioesterase domain-containing protein/acyl carrier protein
MMSKPAGKIFDASASGANDAGPAPVDDPSVDDPATAELRTDFPCSVAQERFWLLDRLDPGNASYNVAVRWRLDGRISSDLLDRTWRTIIDRHEILRTVFPEADGAPIQRVMPQSPFRMDEIDLSALPPEQQQIEGDRIGVIEARAPFDVSTGPLIRVTLLRFSSTSSIILVTTHQIVSDGWSIGVMAREMGVIYDALRHDKPDPLEPLPIQYADYSLWQLEWLRVRGIAAETEYWTRQLAGVKPFKVLPDRPRPAMPTTNGVIVSRVLPRELTNRAQALCAGRGATLFAAALGALCAMLARYTGEDEIVLGTQVSDRNQIELEPMIGQFVNSLILRNDLSGDPRFVEVIDRVRETSAQALEFRHIPIERLLGMVKGEHGKANTPPISVNFIFQKTFIQNTAYTDFALTDMPSLPAGAIYDLNFFMVERPDGWRFSLQYNTDQFEGDTAQRMLAYFQSGLESAILDPQRRVSELRFCAPEESQRLLTRLNDSAAPRPATSVTELFAARAFGSPKAPAVSCAGRTLTYEQLNAQSERLATGLRARGIGLGSRVAICAERSTELLALMLAVMKIGASCVPLDPAESPNFLRRSARELQVSAVAVQGAARAVWKDSGVVAIDIDEMLSGRASVQPLAALPGVTPQSNAYSGVPATRSGGARGYSLTHAQLATVLLEVGQRIGMATTDVLVAASPIGLDLGVAELLLPLVWGARVVIGSAKELETPRALAQLIKRCGATVLHAESTAWSGLLQAGWSPPPGFKLLHSRGALSSAVAQQLLQQGAELWTLYGSPETGIWTAMHHVQPRDNPGLIGTPIAGWSLRVTDRKGRPTEVGATGALLLIDGAGGATPGTGDLARIRGDGQLEWLGRSDRRFMHRGSLVDPASIEALLRPHPQVAEVLVAEGRQAFDGQIVACVLPRDPPAMSAAALLQALRAELEALPAAMIPTVILASGALPLERDGTLNWRALHASGAADRDADRPAAPLHGIEAKLAAIWSSLLGLEDIDPNANFFELGGHSLLAARMLARVDTVFGRRVTLNALFRAPTIRELAQVVEQKDSREFDFRQMVRLQPNGSRPPLIAINNTGTYYPLAKSLGADQPVISLQLFDPSVKTDAMPESLEEVAAGYVQLIQRVQPNGPYNLMGWCVAGALSFEIARQLTAANKQVTNLYLMDAWLPRYIARQPPLRRLVSDYTLRLGLILADWRMFRAGQQSFADFLNNRNSVKGLKRLWNLVRKAPLEPSQLKELSRADYDVWLLHYLQSITNKYEPGRFSGKLTLFRSEQEPTGLLFDPLAGWGPYAEGGVELVMVAGDHFTMFQDPGAGQIAAHITRAMTALELKSATAAAGS